MFKYLMLNFNIRQHTYISKRNFKISHLVKLKITHYYHIKKLITVDVSRSIQTPRQFNCQSKIKALQSLKHLLQLIFLCDSNASFFSFSMSDFLCILNKLMIKYFMMIANKTYYAYNFKIKFKII